MCSVYVWPRWGQGQGHNLRLNFVWLYFVSALYLLNPWGYLQITLHKCQVWWDDVQCLCLTKVGSRSRSQSKIKHCMTVWHRGRHDWFRFRKHPSSFVYLECFGLRYPYKTHVIVHHTYTIADDIAYWNTCILGLSAHGVTFDGNLRQEDTSGQPGRTEWRDPRWGPDIGGGRA